VDYPPGLHRDLGLTDEEFQRIEQILGRAPNRAELAMYSVMWSEHCSYKSSRIHLKSLPTEGPLVLIGPGEGAGVIKLDDVAVAIRLESHNHPSFVEPVEGAATGIGGVVRDVLSMGARPIALLDSLRFGRLNSAEQPGKADPITRFLVEGVVSGISSYGNCIGVPTVGGETQFDPPYAGNPLVNVMCIGVAPIDGLMLARAHGPGNAVLLLGSSTGRDGIGGVSVLASAEFDESSGSKRPSVQVGDPFTEKLLIEACLSLIAAGLVVGIQDLGGAGLCCATSESAAQAGTGMEINLDLVARRESAMAPFEVLTSESQERMLLIVEPGNVPAALAECERMGLAAAQIGRVTDDQNLTVTEKGEVVARVPAASLGDGPVYDRASTKPKWIETLQAASLNLAPPDDLSDCLLQMTRSANLASKRWLWEQYDHQVMLGTVVTPGHDCAVLRIPGAKSRLAVTTDGNGRFCLLDPFLGAQHSVAEAARNLSALGAKPAAITNCLNLGSPEQPEVMWQFIETVKGIGEACRALETPVTGGNVSFYNQTGQTSIFPTPVIGMIGIIPEGAPLPAMGFQAEGDLICLLGDTYDELGGSEYQSMASGRVEGQVPRLDLKAEAALGGAIRGAIRDGIISSAHDCSGGGLGMALVECSIEGGLGARIDPDTDLPLHVWLFAESASRILVSLHPANIGALSEACRSAGVPLYRLGEAGGGSLAIGPDLKVSVAELTGAYENSFPSLMGYPRGEETS